MNTLHNRRVMLGGSAKLWHEKVALTSCSKVVAHNRRVFVVLSLGNVWNFAKLEVKKVLIRNKEFNPLLGTVCVAVYPAYE